MLIFALFISFAVIFILTYNNYINQFIKMIDIGHAAESANVFLHKNKYTFKTIFDFNKPYQSYNDSKEKQLCVTYCIHFQG